MKGGFLCPDCGSSPRPRVRIIQVGEAFREIRHQPQPRPGPTKSEPLGMGTVP